MSRRSLIVGGVLVLALLVALLVGRGGDQGLEVDLEKAETRERFQSFVTASGELVAERYADVGSSIMGRVVDLPVAEGQRVESGDLLARIDPIQAQAQLTASEAAIGALEADFNGAADQVAVSRANVAVAEAQSREASANLERLKALFEKELIAAADLDRARAVAESSIGQVDSARATLARSERALTATAQRVAQARAQADQARDLLERTSIVSPIDGVVSRLQVRQGEMVVIGIQNQPGTVLMTVSDLAELNAEVLVAEADVLRVEVGQEATVTLEALPNRSFRGRVTEVGASALPQLSAGAAAREFRVEIRLIDPAPGLRPGLTCDAEVLVGEKQDVTVVPLQSVVLRLEKNGAETSGVFTVRDGIAAFTPVETGIIGGLDIEVSGIEAGSDVVVGPYQVLRELEDGRPVRAR